MSNELIITPVGRLIAGSFYQGYDKDQYGKPKTDKNNNPVTEYYAGLAIEKSAAQEVLQKVQALAAQLWQQQVQRADFSWKIKDGDVEKKEGSEGCWIFNFSTYYAPKVYASGTATLKTDGKRGDYYRLAFNVATNGNQQKPGIKLYMQVVEHVGYGQEIQGDGATAAVFAAAPIVGAPSGMSRTPVAAATQAPGFAAPQAQAPGFTAPQAPATYVHPFLRAPS